jgi:hypothetical protein
MGLGHLTAMVTRAWLCAEPVAGWPPTVTETAPTGTTGPEMNSVASPAGGFEDRKANPAWTV